MLSQYSVRLRFNHVISELLHFQSPEDFKISGPRGLGLSALSINRRLPTFCLVSAYHRYEQYGGRAGWTCLV